MKTKFNISPKFIHVGFKLFVAGLIVFFATRFSKEIAFTLLILAGLWLHFPFRSFIDQRLRYFRLYEGDDPDPKDADEKALKTILIRTRKHMEKILEKRGVVDKAAMTKEIEKRMSLFKDLTKEDVAKLREMLDEKSPKGVRSILKKQGEKITALEKAKSKKVEASNVRAFVSQIMPKIEKVFQSRKGEIKLNVRAAATMTLENTISGHDDLPEDLIESFSIGAFVPKRQAREYVFDMASRRTVAEITQFKTWLEEGSEQGAFAIVTEGGLKPLVSTSLVRNHSEYFKVAAKQVYTEEFAKFRKEAYAIITRLINQKLIRDYAGILTTKLLADAATYVASALDDQYSNPTDYHAIGAVAAQIEALNFFPDMLIMNPQDKWRIGLTQDLNGQFYLTIPMVDPQGQTRMMGFTLRTSNKVPVGNFLLGESGLWEIEDEAITIRMGMGATITGGTSNGGGDVTDVQMDIDHNRFRIIAETFAHSYIATNNEGSFVYANFDTVKAALASE